MQYYSINEFFLLYLWNITSSSTQSWPYLELGMVINHHCYTRTLENNHPIFSKEIHTWSYLHYEAFIAASKPHRTINQAFETSVLLLQEQSLQTFTQVTWFLGIKQDPTKSSHADRFFENSWHLHQVCSAPQHSMNWFLWLRKAQCLLDQASCFGAQWLQEKESKTCLGDEKQCSSPSLVLLPSSVYRCLEENEEWWRNSSRCLYHRHDCGQLHKEGSSCQMERQKSKLTNWPHWRSCL